MGSRCLNNVSIAKLSSCGAMSGLLDYSNRLPSAEPPDLPVNAICTYDMNQGRVHTPITTELCDYIADQGSEQLTATTNTNAICSFAHCDDTKEGSDMADTTNNTTDENVPINAINGNKEDDLVVETVEIDEDEESLYEDKYEYEYY